MSARWDKSPAFPSQKHLFLLPFLLFCLPAPAQDVFTGVARVVAVGDVHGDYAQFAAVLREAGILDRKDKWAGGKSHFVQTGDLVDRGPDSRKVMDLMIALEKQSAKAGGRVHALIGNHEAMNVYGDQRYTDPGEYAAFHNEKSEAVRDYFWQQYAELMKKDPAAAPLDEAARKKWDAGHPLGFFEHRIAFLPDGAYGKWVRGHNAAVKINDTLFVHGGISPAYAAMSLTAINEQVRKELDGAVPPPEAMILSDDGPLWYRGLSEGDEQALRAHVDAVLTNFGVKRIVAGHTVMKGGVAMRFEGRVIVIDTGLSKAYGGTPSALILEAGTTRVVLARH
ncbi:MAG: metallophosphoesterase [Acidobacteriia bacterium]|nr:metallophosphoesterase [Terriglobia bacterium]